MSDIAEHCYKVKKQFDLYQNDFRKYFGISLIEVWDKIIGLDPIKFDEFINPPDGVSTYQEIEKKYGLEAKKFIKENLIKIGENI